MLYPEAAIHGMVDFPIRSDIRNELKYPPNHHWIQHRVLTFDWETATATRNAGIRLCVHNPKHDTSTQTKTLPDFITDILPYTIPTGASHSRSWDVSLPDLDGSSPPNEYRVIILQLDSARDWEFTAGGVGVRAKEDVLNEDCSLYFVDTGGHVYGPGGLAPPDCRLVYWSIIGRPADKAREFNFYISLIDTVSKKKMPAVFDPSIPDSGGSSIP